MRQNLVIVGVAAAFVSSLAFAPPTPFGVPGEFGAVGNPGDPGESGHNEVVVAEGQPMEIDLSGTAGQDGGDGGPGGAANSCRYSHSEQFMVGAPGGPAGAGGDGGPGGQGGELTIHYDDSDNLQVVSVNLRGGSGGAAGAGGAGGVGCPCPTDRCVPGPKGADGDPGQPGEDGAFGRLVLIPQLEPVEPVDAQAEATLADWAEQPVVVGDHIWDEHATEPDMFAEGSQLPPRFTFYQGIRGGTVALDWQAPQSIENFRRYPVHFALRNPDTGEVEVNLPQGLVWEYDVLRDGDLTTYVVKSVLRPADAKRLKFGGLSGYEGSATVEVRDPSALGNEVPTFFHIEIDRNIALGWENRFSGWIPADLIRYDGGNYRLLIGKLPIVTSTFRHGTIRIRLYAEREFGGQRVTMRIANQKIRIRR